MTQPHPQRCETCKHRDADRSQYPPAEYSCYCNLKRMWVHMYCNNWIGYVGCASHSSATEPAEWSLEEIVSGIQGAFDRGVIAGKKAALEEVLELLSDLKGYADGEYEESNLSDNEREMRIHLEYTNRICGIMRSPRGGAP